jgi:predicted transcriptional regulator
VSEEGAGLSRRERQIMDVIYARGEATAWEVHSALPDAPGKTAVRTILRILEEKGHLKHRQDGLAYVYRPSRARRRAGRSALRKVLHTFFDGSLEKAVAAHLADPTAELAPEELERLANLIRAARAGRS